jgi:hypothetical protein
MRRTVVRLLLLLTATAALATHVASARQTSTVTDNQTVPIDFITTTCTGEVVTISGESHVLFHATGTPSGHGVAQSHIDFQLSGVSASGVSYVVSETVNSTETRDADLMPSTFTSVGRLNVVSQGGADNLSLRTLIHTTINANGELTAIVFQFETECRG